jgi:O-methyltransferase
MHGNLKDVVKPYTMARLDQIRLLMELCQRVEDENIPGDMVECGVWRGGSAAVLASFAARSRFNRKTWLFDSFQGHPFPTKEDAVSKGGQAAVNVGGFKTLVETVEEVLHLVDADMTRVKIVKGWFKNTFPSTFIPQIAILSLDSDWYESEKLAINKFYDYIVPGGFLYSDDFYWWPGCHKAISEFFKSRNIHPVLHQLGETSMWLQKGINEA